ncbi:putative ribonucleoside-diphosphate reductase small chain B [Earliella scabrosa]|nr:putative ribonucleoside-diphosphate reductase small chain B [Earliella scabrosa]
MFQDLHSKTLFGFLCHQRYTVGVGKFPEVPGPPHAIYREQFIWNAYKDAHRSIWSPTDIDLSKDRDQWSADLSEDERDFLSVVLGFFTAADGLVVENLAQRFCAEIQIPEARCFYGVQIMIENVHAEVYSRMVQELVPNISDQRRLFSSITHNPVVQAKCDWCTKWIESSVVGFPTRLVAFSIVEGIFFSSSFAAIFWLRMRGLMPGLVQANVMIARDEGTHVQFACLLYKLLHATVPKDVVYGMVDEAVRIEIAFFGAALPRPLIGMNSDLMGDYVRHIADVLLMSLGFPVLYGKPNPFPFMESIAASTKTNFFERPPSDYRSGIDCP